MMKRFIAFLLCAAMLLSCAQAFAAADYTTAEKLQKQLNAGSGFSADITLDVLDGNGNSTLKNPVQFALNYIYVRATETASAIHSADLSLLDPADGSPVTGVQLYSRDRDTLLQADLLGDDWYEAAGLLNTAAAYAQVIGQTLGSLIPGAKTEEAAADEASAEKADEKAEKAETAAGMTLADFTGVPTLTAALAYIAPALNSEALAGYTDSYTTRVDLWLEGYRQEVEMGKTASGETTLKVSYDVPAAALKSEVKILLLDMLEDEKLTAALKDVLGEDAALLLNPDLQRFYFKVINDLPLEGSFTIDRTVTLKGATVSLEVSLPLYDSETGAYTLLYSRNDDSGENLISLKGEKNELAMSYQHSTTDSGDDLWEGNMTRTEGETAAALHFVLSGSAEESRTEAAEDCYTVKFALEVSTLDGAEALCEPFTAAAEAVFTSQTSKTAATNVSAALTVTPDGGNTLTINLDGRSRKKWAVEAPATEMVNFAELSEDEQKQIILGAIPGLASVVQALSE